jgi:hypothetical protein
MQNGMLHSFKCSEGIFKYKVRQVCIVCTLIISMIYVLIMQQKQWYVYYEISFRIVIQHVRLVRELSDGLHFVTIWHEYIFISIGFRHALLSAYVKNFSVYFSQFLISQTLITNVSNS